MNGIGNSAPRRSREENEALVLGVLKKVNRPVSAYDIVHMLERSGKKMIPNQIYRSLARLMEQHTVVRIEILKAYLPWSAPADLCLICTQCHGVALVEAPVVVSSVNAAAADVRFHRSDHPIEVQGLCDECRLPAPVGELGRDRSDRVDAGRSSEH